MSSNPCKSQNAATEIILRPIGYVENSIDTPRAPAEIRAVDSRIVLDMALVNGLIGLHVGDQLIVIFHFHRSTDYDLCQHPQGDVNRPKRGVFALRSPRRPNPIGVTVVTIVAIEQNVLHVRGLDAINATPVLDLKPVS